MAAAIASRRLGRRSSETSARVTRRHAGAVREQIGVTHTDGLLAGRRCFARRGAEGSKLVITVLPGRRRIRSRPVQLELPLPRGWGGRRGGAGRKMQVPGRKNVAHRAREKHKRAHPVHVVLRSRVRSLRCQFLFPTVRRALGRANRARKDFRLLHFSVQADHLHLIVEADSQRALSRGMQGLAVRIARNVNPLLFRRGSLWAGRYYGRALASPRAFKNAFKYVLNNFRKHGEFVRAERDPCSSSIYDLRRAAPEHVPISPPKTWLGRAG